MVMRRKINAYFLIGLLLLLAWLSFLIVEPFLDFVVGGLLLTFIFHPLYLKVLKVVRVKGLASFIVLTVVTLIVVLPMFFALWSLLRDIQSLASGLSPKDITKFIQQLEVLLAGLTGFGGGNATGNVTADGEQTGGILSGFLIPRLTQWAGTLVADAIGLLVTGALGIFVTAFVMYYGFKDGESFYGFLRDSLPMRETYKDALFREVRDVVNAVFVGNILVAILQGVLGGLGFLLFGLPNPVFWGFVMTILAVLPVIGTPIVWLPAGLILLVQGDTFNGVGILLWGALLVSTIDNILKPKIISEQAHIHPVVVLLGIVGGLAAFGFIGFLLGPLLLALFVALLRIFQRDFLIEKEAPPSLLTYE